MSLAFGTDGVRGPASDFPSGLVAGLARSAARALAGDSWYIGYDPRESSAEIAASYAAGLRSMGRLVVVLGVIPTPGVAYLSRTAEWPAAMISASHNPWSDNGIKLFASGGQKLTDTEQNQISQHWDQGSPGVAVEPESIDGSGLDRYRDWLITATGGARLDGLRVVLDCANGASSAIAGPVFEALGAQVTVIHAHPDGRNINVACGSTDLTSVRAAVREAGADFGLAFDGDADRLLAVDAEGETIDGDEILAMVAIDRHRNGTLVGEAVVATVMANLGFGRGLARESIAVVETPVGDRSVLEALDAHGLVLGGEQSGHVIFRDQATTGDGVLTGLHLAELVQRTGRSLGELAHSAMTKFPQVLLNVEVTERDPQLLERMADDVARVESQLGSEGRVLLRLSGTEPLVRVMVEAATTQQALDAAQSLVDSVRRLA